MEKYEKTLTGNPDELLEWLGRDITIEDSSNAVVTCSDYATGDVRLAIRVYEHASSIENSRISMTVTLLADGDQMFVSAIVAGGSQAVFFDTKDWAGKAFLETFIQSIERYIGQK